MNKRNWKFWLVLGLCCLAIALALCGCGTTAGSLTRQQGWYQTGTNTVAIIQRDVVPYVPAPWNAGAEVVLAAAAGALTMWNAHQQKALKELKNGQQPQPTLQTKAS